MGKEHVEGEPQARVQQDDSSLKCNAGDPIELDLIGCFWRHCGIEDLSRRVVHDVLETPQILVGEGREVNALGQDFATDAAGAFIGAAPPGDVGTTRALSASGN
jgi:hypothetical protein